MTETAITGGDSLIVGCVQMTSTPDMAASLDQAARLVAEARDAGAELVALPEMSAMLAPREATTAAARPLGRPSGGGAVPPHGVGQWRVADGGVDRGQTAGK